jgi:hypothetical protein
MQTSFFGGGLESFLSEKMVSLCRKKKDVANTVDFLKCSQQCPKFMFVQKVTKKVTPPRVVFAP